MKWPPQVKASIVSSSDLNHCSKSQGDRCESLDGSDSLSREPGDCYRMGGPYMLCSISFINERILHLRAGSN